MTHEKMPILRAKIERTVKANDAPRVEFLIMLASHKGLIMPDSIQTSFANFKQKYGEGKFAEILSDFKDDGIVTENYGIQFAVNDERGQFDYKSGEQLSEFVSRLAYEASSYMKQTIEDLLKEPEGRELLAYAAKENGIHVLDGIEPKIKDVIGRRSYQQIVDKLVMCNILTEYAWSSKRHGYTGYKLLPWVGVYLKKELGIYELMDVEKSVLSYLACMNNVFDFPADRWFIWVNNPNEFDRRNVQLTRLHGKMVAELAYRTESEVLKAIEELKRKRLIEEQDLGYTKGGLHRGKVLELTEAGAKVASQAKDDMLNKVEQKTKEIFSDRINGAVYYLFCKEEMPVKILSSVLMSSVHTLQRCGLIGERTGIQLEFKTGTFYSDYVNSGIDPEDVKAEFREKCTALLSPQEKLLLGFLSESKHIILHKQLDTKSWSAVTPRTRRKYDEAYGSLILNFKPLMKLFSYVTGLPLEQSEKIASILEEKSFLVREDMSDYGFPGQATIYRVAIIFNFDIDAAPLKAKANEYIGFLAKDLERNYRQLMFLDYLTQLYDKHDYYLVIDRHYVEPILEFLRYSPPTEYSPIYAFEDETVLLYPPVKGQLEDSISELKSKLAEPVRAAIVRLTNSYENNVSFNYWAADRNGYFIVEIESPDPAIGTVSFVVTAWVYVYDIEKIKVLCSKSSTINLFVSYPNYPQVKNIISDEARYNLFIIRHDTAYVWLNRLDMITQNIVTTLSKQIRVIKEEAEVELPEGEEYLSLPREIDKYVQRVRELFLNSKEKIEIVSPYIDDTTFTDFLSVIPKLVEVKVITCNTGGKGRDQRTKKAWEHLVQEGRTIYVRKLNLVEETEDELKRIEALHGRYLIVDNDYVIPGMPDLKRGASGRRKGELVKISRSPSEVRRHREDFQDYWAHPEKNLPLDVSTIVWNPRRQSNT
jgi:hypothetical protein